MIELTTETVPQFLRERGWITEEPATVELLAGGVSNMVWRVCQGAKRLVLKQSRPKLRTEQAWFSDPKRIFREMEVMGWLARKLPPQVVPAILHRDDEHYVFAMSHAPDPAIDWRSTLLQGGFDPVQADWAGRILAVIHTVSQHHRSELEPFRDRTIFEQLRTDPFYRKVQEKHVDLRIRIQSLIDRLHHEELGLCHGDFSPKNLLAHPGGFVLVDYETAHWGDVTMDLGFFLSHLLLKAIWHYPNSEPMLALTLAFWYGYRGAAQSLPIDAWFPAICGHLGVCLLARVDGTSPVPYLRKHSQQETARRVGRALVLQRHEYGDWQSVLDLFSHELQQQKNASS